ncbi:MAG TPA: hydroxymethylbilane synthase [Candidatus Saccharimonadales bacterium]|nr:hydroxymethylbilane synthase [Candidatus Saccharimonadales bacterium]
MKIILGARGSKLSIVQTNIVKEKLTGINPELQIEIRVITTKGDKNMAPIPLDTIGKGWFTKELDSELLLGNIDIAVHSLKDLPETLPNGLIIAGLPERGDPRDVLVSKENISLENLKKHAIIGTDSIRRKIQILNKRPDIIVKSIRGNVDSRLMKLETESYDGVILAAAGLERLGLSSKITEYFAVADIIPSPGQGTLAVVVKKENKNLCELIKKLNHMQSVIASEAERAFSKQLGGGCKTPTGAFAHINDEKLIVYGVVGSLDGQHIFKESIEGKPSEAKQLGITLAKILLNKSKQI